METRAKSCFSKVVSDVSIVKTATVFKTGRINERSCKTAESFLALDSKEITQEVTYVVLNSVLRQGTATIATGIHQRTYKFDLFI